MNDVFQGLWRDIASTERHDYDGTVDLMINWLHPLHNDEAVGVVSRIAVFSHYNLTIRT